MELPILQPRSPSSYTLVVGTPEDLSYRLSTQSGIIKHAPRSPYELARFVTPGKELIIIYRSGSVLCQGQLLATRQALAPFIARTETMEATLW